MEQEKDKATTNKNVAEDFAIFLEDFCDFLTALEASVVQMKQQISKLVGVAKKPLLSEETFNVLKWQSEKGARIGDFEVAYKSQNALDNWQHAYNILKVNNAVIGNPFHEDGYVYRYWVYEKYDDRIFRKKLSEKEVKA
jgi:hypothetical protein